MSDDVQEPVSRPALEIVDAFNALMAQLHEYHEDTRHVVIDVCAALAWAANVNLRTSDHPLTNVLIDRAKRLDKAQKAGFELRDEIKRNARYETN